MTTCTLPPPVDDNRSVVPSPDTGLESSVRSMPNRVPPQRIVFNQIPEYRRGLPDLLFPVLLVITAAISIGGGLFARRIPPVRRAIEQTAIKIRTEFHFSEPLRKVIPPPVPKPVVPKPDEKPVDLTKKKLTEELPPIIPQTEPEPQPLPDRKPVRKVFGLRKVYSTGLGSGGSMSDAVVGKIGNTINKEYDTVTATESDIRGTVVSTATVTTAPRFRKVVKPEYTPEMIEGKVQGTVKVKVLVDIDGKVKKATCINDIGFNSATQAVKATMAMLFDPAMRGSDPVAVWIIVPIRFVLLG